MKKILLATVAAIALSGASAGAQITGPGTPVYDATAVFRLLQSFGVETQQLAQLVATYNEIVQVYGMAKNIWNDVEELVGADKWAPGLTADFVRNPLPYNPADQPGFVGGFRDPASLQYGSQYLSQNTVGGDPTIYDDGYFLSGELRKAVNVLSSMQAVANIHINSITTRLLALNDLFAQLAKIGTIQETDSLSTRLNNELNYAHSQHVQASSVYSAAQLQLAVLEYNQHQYLYQDEGKGVAAACNAVKSIAGNFLLIHDCSGPTGYYTSGSWVAQ